MNFKYRCSGQGSTSKNLLYSRPVPDQLFDQDMLCHNGCIKTAVLSQNKMKIAVILGYYDGEAYVAEQLQSIFGQSLQRLNVFVSDDKSSKPFCTDDLCLDAGQLAKLSSITNSRNVGFAKNFLNTLARIDGSFEFFAFSDQDDIWYKDKLDKAIKVLSRISPDMPALYCGRTEIVDAACEKTLGFSPIFRKPPSFANALVQNIGGANTMVFNKSARDLIVESSLQATVVSHDWWCYQIITGAGGFVFYDPEPCLKYRQHGNNQVGENMGWAARFARIRGLMQGRFRAWNDINLKALLDHKHLLTEKNRLVLSDFVEARQSHVLKRFTLFKRSRVYRQTLLGSLGLWIGILLNRV